MEKIKLAIVCFTTYTKYVAAFICLLAFGVINAFAQEAVSPIPVAPAASNLLPGKKAPVVTDIWVVFKTHSDLGYTMSVEAVLKKYRVDMMDSAIRLIDADRKNPVDERFKWTVDGWLTKADILGPSQTPERKQKIEQAIKDGAISVHALPANMESDVMEQEDYVRSLIFTSQIDREYGLPLSIAGKMTDVPAHSWFLPTLLHNAGIKFLQLGCNYTDQPVRLPQLFWWEGPDGSRILCNYTPHYGSDLLPPKDWPAKNYLAVTMSHDNAGPPSAKEVEELRNGNSRSSLEMQLKKWSGDKNVRYDTTMGSLVKNKKIKIHFATLDEFANAVLAENPDLPVIRGDMVDPWIHGVMAMPQESKTARNVRPLEPALDILNTELKNWGIATTPLAASLAKAYENSMLFSEHTFGASGPGNGFFSADGKTNLPDSQRFLYNDAFVKARKEGFYKKFEASFRDKARYIEITDSIVTNNLASRLKLLADNVKTNAGHVIVYNPLPWMRSGIVNVNGKEMLAENIPANGYKVISATQLSPVDADKNVNTLNTPFYTVKFDTQKGGITSLIEKSTGKELVDQKSKYVLGQYLHERFSYDQTKDYDDRAYKGTSAAIIKPNMPKDISYLATTLSDWTMKTTQSAVGTKVTLTTTNTTPIAQAVSVSFTFPNAFAYVDVEWNVENKVPNTVPEGGWLCFPFKVNKPKYILGRLGGAMDLAKDQIIGGNRYIYAVESGASIVAPNQSGVGICPIDAPLLSFGEPGLWKYDYDYFPKQPTVFVNLYNNMWNTNFPYWTEGSWSERVRIWGIQPGVKTSENLAVKSWEARVPLMAVMASGEGTKLPAQQSGIAVSRKGVLVTAFGNDPDGNEGTLLRVWEEAGNSGLVTVSLPAGKTFKKATPVNLRGEISGKPVKIVKGKFNCKLMEFGPASFILG